jgi:hypothetical protein
MRAEHSRKAGFGAGIGAEAALLIVDMINPFDFAGADALLGPALRAARNIRGLRNRFDRAGAPVVYVNDNFMHWQGDFRDLIASCLGADAPGAAIAQLLQPAPNHYYILKPKHSGFHRANAEYFQARGSSVQQISLSPGSISTSQPVPRRGTIHSESCNSGSTIASARPASRAAIDSPDSKGWNTKARRDASLPASACCNSGSISSSALQVTQVEPGISCQ